MSAYVIVNVDTKHPEEYERYKQMAQETVAQYGGRCLVRGGQMNVLEEGPRVVALSRVRSGERAAPRLSTTDLLIVDGHRPTS